jgi:hypothetical protein
MIVKKVKYRQTGKPKAWQIGDLVDYIRHPRNVNPLEKIEHSGGKNFFGTTHAGQKGEMIGLASESVHSKMPVSHWIFSWKENEQPSAAQVDELVDIFLEKMGLTGHQVIYGLHYNTENYHVHIAVNRMNPETLKVVQPHNGFDIEEAHKILAVVEAKQGWSGEKNARYSVNKDGEIVPRLKLEIAPKPKAAALNFECATGEKSAQRIAQERGHSIIKNAKFWKEVHQKLAEAGLRFEKKGSGAVIFVGEIAVKASSVDRAFSMKNLCKKLGEFEPGTYAPENKNIDPEPVSAVNFEEWKTYRSERAEAEKMPLPVLENGEVLEMKKRHLEERRTILSRMGQRGFSMLNIARHGLKLRQHEELRRLRQARKPRLRRGVPRFETWLRDRGLHRQADLWRYKDRLAVKRQKTPTPAPPARPADKAISAYAAHRETIRKEKAAQDLSRIDAMIALRMRSTGHSREAVAEAIRQCASKAHEEKESRDWQRYAERAVAYAFGIAGDVELARSEALRKQWEKAEAPDVPDAPRPETPRMRMMR